jgi:hypothetical protein
MYCEGSCYDGSRTTDRADDINYPSDGAD